MPRVFQEFNIGSEVMQMFRHLAGEAFSDRVLGGKLITRDEKGQIKYKPLSSDDNALLASLISQTAAKMASTALTPEEESKFFMLLSGTADKFKMSVNSPLKIWPAFLAYLTKQDKPPVSLLKQKLLDKYGWTTPLSADRQYQLAEELRKTLASPFIRLLLGMDNKEEAKQLIKDFCDLKNDKSRLAFYLPYLSTANIQESSPAIILPAFFRYLYAQTETKAKNKLIKRAAIGLKHLSRHMGGVLQTEAGAIQWLGLPFIELMKCMAVQSESKAELFLTTFCGLPDNEARLNFYQMVIAQPEHPVDLAIRLLDEIIEFGKNKRNEFEQAYKDALKPGGWRNRTITKFSKKADKFYQESNLYY